MTRTVTTAAREQDSKFPSPTHPNPIPNLILTPSSAVQLDFTLLTLPGCASPSKLSKIPFVETAAIFMSTIVATVLVAPPVFFFFFLQFVLFFSFVRSDCVFLFLVSWL
jgi:hypothetical protein